jgi:hypothetical protein
MEKKIQLVNITLKYQQKKLIGNSICIHRFFDSDLEVRHLLKLQFVFIDFLIVTWKFDIC